MKPRITFNVTTDGEFELWLNEQGRDLLMHELQNLSEESDHFHFGTWEGAEVQVQATPYRPTDTVLEYGKIYFRTDAWDEKYFPHVITTE
jgi:hypothetical protein